MGRASRAPEALAVPRDPSGFAPFPSLPAAAAERVDGWLHATHIEPVSAVEWQCSDRWSLGPRRVNDSMWFWIEDGSGWGRVGARGGRFRLQPEDLMLIPKDTEHVLRQDEGVAMHLFSVHFQAWVFGSINLLDLLGFPPYARGDGDGFFERAMKRLAREYALKAPGWREAMSAEVLRVLLHILRHNGLDFRLPGALGEGLPRLLPALEFIDANLTDSQMHIRDLSQRVFLSEVQFRKLFKRVTGAAPVQFIRRRRIDHACRLLVTTEMSVEQTALASGFNDVPYFCRVFKTLIGASPGRYRSGERI